MIYDSVTALTDRSRKKKKRFARFFTPLMKQESQLFNLLVVSPLSFKEKSLQVGQVRHLQRE